MDDSLEDEKEGEEEEDKSESESESESDNEINDIEDKRPRKTNSLPPSHKRKAEVRPVNLSSVDMPDNRSFPSELIKQ